MSKQTLFLFRWWLVGLGASTGLMALYLILRTLRAAERSAEGVGALAFSLWWVVLWTLGGAVGIALLAVAVRALVFHFMFRAVRRAALSSDASAGGIVFRFGPASPWLLVVALVIAVALYVVIKIA
jgi:hypothetical protein